MIDRDIVITLPSNIEWNDYQKELDAVKDGRKVLNFKVPFLPRKDIRNSIKKCYLVYRGYIIGWQRVCGFVEDTSFNCGITGKRWEGNFIQRTGEFHKLDNPVEMKGFRGWKYIYL